MLAIGYTPNATFEILPRLVPKFRARWPEVRLDLLELRSPDQPDARRSGRTEVGLACMPIDTGDLVQRAVAREQMVIALPAAHPLAKRTRVPVTALRDLPYIRVPPEIEPGWSQQAFAALTEAGVSLTIAQEADTKLAMLGLVAAGMGVSVVSESMSNLGPRGVAFRPLSGVAAHAHASRPRPSVPGAHSALRLTPRTRSRSSRRTPCRSGHVEFRNAPSALPPKRPRAAAAAPVERWARPRAPLGSAVPSDAGAAR